MIAVLRVATRKTAMQKIIKHQSDHRRLQSADCASSINEYSMTHRTHNSGRGWRIFIRSALRAEALGNVYKAYYGELELLSPPQRASYM